MKTLFIYLIPIVLLTACGQSNVEEETTSTEGGEETTSPVEAKKLSEDKIQFTGVMTTTPESFVSVHSPSKGIIKHIYVLKGEFVKKGTPLLRMEHPEIITLQENYLRSASEAEFWEKEYSRKKSLFDQKIISDKEYQSCVNSRRTAQAVYESQRKQLEFLGITPDPNSDKIESGVTIRAARNGYVVDLLVNSGKFVDQDVELLQIASTDEPILEMHVFPNDLESIKENMVVQYKVPGAEDTFEAKVYNVGKMIDLKTKSITVLAKPVDKELKCPLGSTVFVEVKVEP